jgi:Outer membrane protein beta-barrel domain
MKWRSAEMGRANKIVILISLAFLVCGDLNAQDESEKINSNLGAAVSLPLSPTSDFVKTSWGIVAGAGYNFSEHHSLIGEFMWSALYPSEEGLQPIRVALNDNSITGHGNLYALTANYRYQTQGRLYGAYVIGGGGWYYRTSGFTGPVMSGSGIACAPAWRWWGFTCSSGTVTPNQSLGGYSSSVFGGNVGMGLTRKITDSGYRIYIEPRYHYAPTKNEAIHLLQLTFGIRY